MSAEAQAVLDRIRELSPEDRHEVVRALNVNVLPRKRLEEVLGKYQSMPLDPDLKDHDRGFLEAIEASKE